MLPVVSIIVNCFNQGRYLERSVKSVLDQTFTDLECIIVDDGSTDNTRKVAEHLMTLDSRVKYFYKENGGLPSARNFGVQKAQGEWIQCLDADDWIHEDKTRFQLEHLQGIDATQDIVFYSDYERVFIGADETIVDRQKNVIGSLTKDELIQRILTPDVWAASPHPVLQQAMLMKKSAVSKSKFPEHLKALGDRYFALDLVAKDVKFIYTPLVGAFYTKHQSNRTNNWKYMENYYISFYEEVKKNHKDLLSLCQPSLERLANETVREKTRDHFERLLHLIQFPIYLFDIKFRINNIASLKNAYKMRMVLPNFLLYEKYRGPRSKKIVAIISRLIGARQ